MDLTPIFRIEKFLDAIINSTTPPEPMFRVEYFLAKIGGADVVTPDPVFRIEKYLAKILGEDVEIPEPMFRTEFWLAKKCGEDVETPDPAFRVEYWLEEWCGGSAPTYETVTGKIVSFLTQRIAPLKIEADLSPIQDLHGYDAPWPPGGGKNKFDGVMVKGIVGNDGGYSNVNNRITSYKATITDNTYLAEGTYTLSAENLQKCTVLTKDSNGTIIDNWAGAWRDLPFTFTMTSAGYLFFTLRKNDNSNISPDDFKAQVEAGESSSAWTPYSNECPISGHTGCEVYVEDEYDAQATPTVTISFGQTVYGGKLTVFEDGTGQIEAEYEKRAITSFGGAWGAVVNGYAVYTAIYGTTNNIDAIEALPYMKSNIFKFQYRGKQNADLFTYGGSNGASVTQTFILPLTITSLAEADAWLANNPIEATFKLATPITIPLSPGQVEALQGNNTVWVNDSDEIKVTYRSN